MTFWLTKTFYALFLRSGLPMIVGRSYVRPLPVYTLLKCSPVAQLDVGSMLYIKLVSYQDGNNKISFSKNTFSYITLPPKIIAKLKNSQPLNHSTIQPFNHSTLYVSSVGFLPGSRYHNSFFLVPVPCPKAERAVKGALRFCYRIHQDQKIFSFVCNFTTESLNSPIFLLFSLIWLIGMNNDHTKTENDFKRAEVF